MGERKRRLFSSEFKQDAVRRVTEGGRSVGKVAAELGIRPDMLRDWKARAQEGSEQTPAEPVQAVSRPSAARTVFERPGSCADQEVRRLRHQLASAQEEVAFLRRVAMYFASSNDFRPPRVISLGLRRNGLVRS